MKFFRTLSRFVTVIAILSLYACAQTRQTRSVETTGFLGDYSMLKKGEGGQAQLVYIKPGLNLNGVNKVIIDPITIMRASDSSVAKLSDDELKMLSDSLYITLAEELGKSFEIVNRPGSGTIRIRAAITEARGSKVAMDVITSVIPQTRTLTTLGGLATDTDLFVGKAAVEAEALDAQTGERLWAAVDERVGNKKIIGSAKKWSDVHEAYGAWATRLHERLLELGAGAPKTR